MHQPLTFHLDQKGETGFGYAQAVQVGHSLYIAGTIALGDDMTVLHPGDTAAQLGIVYGKLKRTLERFGADFRHVVKENIFTTDMAALVAANVLRIAYFSPSHLPTTTAVEVAGLVFPGLMLEVELVARLDKVVNQPAGLLE